MLLESSLGGDRLVLTLPALPDRTLRQCHEFLRELLYAFEEEYQEPLARSYGWSLDPEEEPDDEEEEDEI